MNKYTCKRPILGENHTFTDLRACENPKQNKFKSEKSPRHVIMKLMKTKDTEKNILKVAGES